MSPDTWHMTHWHIDTYIPTPIKSNIWRRTSQKLIIDCGKIWSAYGAVQWIENVIILVSQSVWSVGFGWSNFLRNLTPEGLWCVSFIKLYEIQSWTEHSQCSWSDWRVKYFISGILRIRIEFIICFYFSRSNTEKI